MPKLATARIDWTDQGCVTTFPDGRIVESIPHPMMPDYQVITARCGYSQPMDYCREHDFCHLFLAERLTDTAAASVLREVSIGRTASPWRASQEEALVMAFQRWLRAGERPIIGPGVDWHGLKADALAALAAKD